MDLGFPSGEDLDLAAWSLQVYSPRQGGLTTVSHPERTKGMNWLIIDNAFGLALICFYLFLDQCGHFLTRMKRSRIFPKKRC